MAQRKLFLVIEDNADDAALIARSFETLGGCRAFVCRSISEAKAYLLGAGMYHDRKVYPFPAVLICDLRIGEDSGFQFLTWLRLGSDFEPVPFVVLSKSESALASAIELGGIEVVRKPDRPEELKTVIAELANKLCGLTYQPPT